jgi:hypothetical protein
VSRFNLRAPSFDSRPPRGATGRKFRATRNLPPFTRYTSEEMCVAGEATVDQMQMTAHYDFKNSYCTNCTFESSSVTCGHYLNMKSAVLTQVACGFSTGGWYTQDFWP